MSIVIPIDMPKTCRRCMEVEIPVQCRVKEQEPITAVMTGYNRPEDCPLKELPPHGRLIDADALGIDDSWSLTDTGRIWNAPTILEATK